MSKRFIKINNGAGPVQLPGGYPANDGQVAVLDDTEPRLQEYFDYPATAATYEETIAKLVTANKVEDYGLLTQVSTNVFVHTVVKPLADIANGEVLQFTPGFKGYVLGFNAFSLLDATTAAKLATLGWSIKGPGHADIVVGASANPATLDLTSAAVTDGGTISGEAIVYNDRDRNVFTATDAIVVTASAVTAFTEGEIILTTILAKGTPPLTP